MLDSRQKTSFGSRRCRYDGCLSANPDIPHIRSVGERDAHSNAIFDRCATFFSGLKLFDILALGWGNSPPRFPCVGVYTRANYFFSLRSAYLRKLPCGSQKTPRKKLTEWRRQFDSRYGVCADSEWGRFRHRLRVRLSPLLILPPFNYQQLLRPTILPTRLTRIVGNLPSKLS
jgi:hypothetical protein